MQPRFSVPELGTPGGGEEFQETEKEHEPRQARDCRPEEGEGTNSIPIFRKRKENEMMVIPAKGIQSARRFHFASSPRLEVSAAQPATMKTVPAQMYGPGRSPRKM